MKVIELKVSNVKRISAAWVRPDTDVIEVTGANGAGKSSVLDSIMYALAGGRSLPEQPLRRGEKAGLIEVDLGRIKATLRLTRGGKRLEVTAADGERLASPQSVLNEMIGQFTFDPTAFMRDHPSEQARTLAKLAGVDWEGLSAKVQQTYEHRRAAAKAAKMSATRVESLRGRAPAEPLEPVDTQALAAKLQEVQQNNAYIAEAKREAESKVYEAERKHARVVDQLDDIERQITDLQQRINELVDKRERGDEAERIARQEVQVARALVEEARAVSETNTDELLREIGGARAHNDLAAAWLAFQEAREEHAIAQREHKEADSMLTRAREARDQATASAKMPIDGLSISYEDDMLVTYNGIPLDQASQAEQLRVSMAIAMALNPQLHVILIRDGSLLDEHSMAAIRDMARESEYQVWIERVDTSGTVGVYIEDGHLASVHGVPVLPEQALNAES